MKDRVCYFDILRAMEIFCVIAIHLSVIAYKNFSPQEFSVHLSLVGLQFIDFALSIYGFFLFIIATVSTVIVAVCRCIKRRFSIRYLRF